MKTKDYQNLSSGENATSAENQQERLINLGWIIGFVDGEGCFSIGFVKQQGGANRKGYRTGYQVFHEFAVTQGAKNIDALHEIQKFFGVGQVVVNRRYDNHKEHLYRYVVRKRKDLKEIIIPFFKEYRMHTTKQADFEKFVKCIDLVEKGCHLDREGLILIAEITETMNRQKSKQELIRILRDHTPNIPAMG